MNAPLIKRSYLLIVNPISGGKSQSNSLNKFRSFFDKNPSIESKTILTEKEGLTAKKIAEKHLKSKYQVFIVVGGDGTINEVATVVTGTEKILAFFPRGSGNGLCNSLYGKQTTRELFHRIFYQSEIKLLDQGILATHSFFNLAGFGFDALIAGKFCNSKRRGFLSYLLLVIKHYMFYKEDYYQIVISDQVLEGKFLMICLANGNQFGNNIVISPHSKQGDGFIDLCLVKKISVAHLPMVFFKILFKEYHWDKYVEYHRIKECVISTDQKKFFHIDGEFVVCSRDKYKFVLRERALRVLA